MTVRSLFAARAAMVAASTLRAATTIPRPLPATEVVALGPLVSLHTRGVQVSIAKENDVNRCRLRRAPATNTPHMGKFKPEPPPHPTIRGVPAEVGADWSRPKGHRDAHNKAEQLFHTVLAQRRGVSREQFVESLHFAFAPPGHTRSKKKFVKIHNSGATQADPLAATQKESKSGSSQTGDKGGTQS